MTVSELCRLTRNFFDRCDDPIAGQFTFRPDTIPAGVVKGQYFLVCGSIFNDGVHKAGDGDLTAETFNGTVQPMRVPDAFVALAEKIDAYDKALPSGGVFVSQSFHGWSGTMATGSDGLPVDGLTHYRTMTREHPQYEMLQKMSTVVAVKQDGTEIWRGRILNHEADWYNNRAVYCEGALSYFNDSSLPPFNYEGTLKEFLQHLIEIHNTQVGQRMKQFELGTVTAALGDLVVHFGDADKYGVGEDYGKIWDIIDKMVLKTFGGYVYCSFNAKTGLNVLNYCDQAYEAGRQTAQDIEYGVNLLDLTEKTDTNNLYIKIYGIKA